MMNTELSQSIHQVEYCTIMDWQELNQFIQQLEVARAGLGTVRGIRYDSFVFKDGWIYTFNHQILCSIKCGLMIQGAINAEYFLEVLKGFDQEYIQVEINDHRILITGMRSQKRISVSIEKEFKFPFDDKVSEPETWKPLSSKFAQAIETVALCAGDEETEPDIVSIHLTKYYIEACDDYHLCRYKLNTGIEQSVIMKAECLTEIVRHGMTKFSLSKEWAHFQNDEGVMMSCESLTKDDIYMQDLFPERTFPYPVLDHLLDIKSDTVPLPRELIQAISKTGLFKEASRCGDEVQFDFIGNRLKVSVSGLHRTLQETFELDKPVNDLSFRISSPIIKFLDTDFVYCDVSENRLKVNMGRHVYVACIGKDLYKGWLYMPLVKF